MPIFCYKGCVKCPRQSLILQVTVKSIIGPAQHLFKGITFEIASKNGTAGGKMTLHINCPLLIDSKFNAQNIHRFDYKKCIIWVIWQTWQFRTFWAYPFFLNVYTGDVNLFRSCLKFNEHEPNKLAHSLTMTYAGFISRIPYYFMHYELKLLFNHN